MRTDSELRVSGLRALVEALGPVEAERFVSLLLREPFDYTKWQSSLWPEMTVEDISKAAMELRRRSRKRQAEQGRSTRPR
jgi:hypothetical protein